MATLTALQRNRYFFGKLMDVEQFEKEQRYFRSQAALLNRLALGSGVLCGLNVAADPAQAGNVRITPGVAIDGWGRLILVPEPFSLNPAQLTDDNGAPDGKPIDKGTVLLSLSYAETCADPVAVFVNDCDTPGECTSSTIREGFRVLVRTAGQPPAPPSGCVFKKLSGSSPAELHKLLVEYVSNACPAPPKDPSIPIARIEVPGGAIDVASDRPLVYTNELLWKVLECLVEG